MTLSSYALVTLDQVKAYLKIDGTDHDAVLEEMIETASRMCEDYCNVYWVQREITETRLGDGRQKLYLYKQPLVSVESVEIDDEDIGLTFFTIFESNSSIYYASGWTLDAIVEIVYTAGVATTAALARAAEPKAVNAVLACVADWFNNPVGVKAENVAGVGSTTFQDQAILPPLVRAQLAQARKRII